MTKYLYQNTAKKIVKKLSPLTIFLFIIFLLIGAGSAFLAMNTICKNDTIEVLGTKEILFTTSAVPALYTDQGIKVIILGQDFSNSVKIESDLPLENGAYKIDRTLVGEYYIKYTITHIKVGTVTKYRTISVVEGI